MSGPRSAWPLLACAIALSGCDGLDLNAQPSEQSAENVPEALPILEQETVLPKLDRTESLKGLDADEDGIRDDIEGVIEGTSVSEVQKESLKTFARGMQRIQTADEMTPQLAGQITDSYTADYFCSTAFSPNAEEILKIYDQLEAFTANTPERAQRYLEYTKAMDGRNISLPSSQRCGEVAR